MPVYYEGTIILAGRGLFGIDVTDGSVQWHVHESAKMGQPSLRDGILYAGLRNGTANGIVALDSATGETVWQVNVEEYAEGVITTSDSLYVPTYSVDPAADTPISGTAIRRLSRADGETLWRYETAPDPSLPTVGGDSCYVLHDEGMDAIDVEEGTRDWRASVDRGFLPSYEDGDLFVSSGNALEIRSASTGNVEWSVAVEGHPIASAALGEDRVVIATNEPSALVAVDRKDKQIDWQRTTEQLFSAPIISGDSIFIGTADSLQSRDLTDGTLRWERATKSRDGGDVIHSGLPTTPLALDGTVFFGTNAGDVYRLD